MNNYQTQLLSGFLKDELLRVYEARGGRKVKYPKMREQLLKYFNKQKIGGKTYWRRELGNATLGDEGLDIYGMRLVEIAELAYPNFKSVAACHLNEHYLK